jgi:hypothetical protein
VRTIALSAVLGAAMLLAPVAQAQGPDDEEIKKLRDELQSLQASIQGMNKELGRELAYVRDRLSLVVATTFLQSPPIASDVVGVARVAVFAPRIEAETGRERDTLHLRVKRVDASGLRLIGPDLHLPAGTLQAPLPVDQNGALYVVDWWTSEGFTFTVQLRDGASELTAASVQVRPLQNRGRFLYVAYKVE